jgi:hypothetical protein
LAEFGFFDGQYFGCFGFRWQASLANRKIIFSPVSRILPGRRGMAMDRVPGRHAALRRPQRKAPIYQSDAAARHPYHTVKGYLHAAILPNRAGEFLTYGRLDSIFLKDGFVISCGQKAPRNG